MYDNMYIYIYVHIHTQSLEYACVYLESQDIAHLRCPAGTATWAAREAVSTLCGPAAAWAARATTVLWRCPGIWWMVAKSESPVDRWSTSHSSKKVSNHPKLVLQDFASIHSNYGDSFEHEHV